MRDDEKSSARERLARLIDVKSIVTLTMTGALAALLFCGAVACPREVLALYCTSYGAVITYFFTRKDDENV